MIVPLLSNLFNWKTNECKHFSYWVLENKPFEIFFAKSAKEEGERDQKENSRKIRDAFVDDFLF